MAIEVDWLSWLHSLSDELAPVFAPLEEREERQTERILTAFSDVGLGQHHFAPTTGYGYHDAGRNALETVFARIWDAEAALVRQQIVSGTQAISLCLSTLCRPGREVLFAGEPYDTLQTVIGLRVPTVGSLLERGVKVRIITMPDAFDPGPRRYARKSDP